MSNAPEPPPTTSDATPDATPDAAPQGTPIRSLFAVATGWVALFVLGQLEVALLAALAPTDIPSAEGALPTARGLALYLLGSAPNGLVAGLLTGRVAGFAPIVHGVVLAAWIGFSGMMSSDAAQGLPWWFATGRIVTPALPVVLGGALARHLARRRAAAA